MHWLQITDHGRSGCAYARDPADKIIPMTVKLQERAAIIFAVTTITSPLWLFGIIYIATKAFQ